MEYKIYFYEKGIKKDYDKVMANFSKKVEKRTLDFLKKTPFFGTKRKQFYKYDLPSGNRILYLILNPPPIVGIVCIGDHDDYMKYLKKYAKKR